MAQQKGHTGNPNGRPKGTPNKVTTDLRTWVNDILQQGKERFICELEKLPPEEYVRVFTTLLNYVVPKQQAVSVEAQIEAEYRELKIMLETAPDEAVNAIAQKYIELENQKDNENKID